MRHDAVLWIQWQAEILAVVFLFHWRTLNLLSEAIRLETFIECSLDFGCIGIEVFVDDVIHILPIQRYEHFDVHVYRSLLHYGDLELLQCFIISIRQYDSESVSLYVSGASWMQRDAAIVTGLFVAANACFIIFSNH